MKKIDFGLIFGIVLIGLATYKRNYIDVLVWSILLVVYIICNIILSKRKKRANNDVTP